MSTEAVTPAPVHRERRSRVRVSWFAWSRPPSPRWWDGASTELDLASGAPSASTRLEEAGCRRPRIFFFFFFFFFFGWSSVVDHLLETTVTRDAVSNAARKKRQQRQRVKVECIGVGAERVRLAVAAGELDRAGAVCDDVDELRRRQPAGGQAARERAAVSRSCGATSPGCRWSRSRVLAAGPRPLEHGLACEEPIPGQQRQHGARQGPRGQRATTGGTPTWDASQP